MDGNGTERSVSVTRKRDPHAEFELPCVLGEAHSPGTRMEGIPSAGRDWQNFGHSAGQEIVITRSAIARSTKPIPRKRSKPRRGRVVDKARLKWAATQPCCITGEHPATTHHVREYGSPKDDTKIIRLVARLHQKAAFDYTSSIPCVEDGKEVFEEFHRVSINDEVRKLQLRYERLGRK